jgi:hypothetical protein
MTCAEQPRETCDTSVAVSPGFDGRQSEMFARPSLISIVVLAGLIPIAHIGRRQPETAQILWQFEAGG